MRILRCAVDGCWVVLDSFRCVCVDFGGGMDGQISLHKRNELFDLVWVEAFFQLFDERVQFDDALWSMIDNLEPLGSIQSQGTPPCFGIIDRVAASLELVEEGGDVLGLLMRTWSRCLAERGDGLW